MNRTIRELASTQAGYFRTDQALVSGLSRGAVHHAVETGEIERIRYGLYRFAHFPPTPNDELHELQLLEPRGTFSHETALTQYGLTDLLPRAIHFSVPLRTGFRPRPGVTIHHFQLGPKDRVLRDGLWLTSLPRTFRDAARSGVDPDQLIEAAREAEQRAMISREDLRALASTYPYAVLTS